ncbi:myosin-10-like, partial [Trifolium medium]|nr:myosin-10-like [Trifolium medium]
MAKQVEEAAKERQSLRSEIEKSSHMMVTGIEKISAKVNGFGGNGSQLPRSQKYTGMAAVTYGVIKRANEIVEELLKQNDASVKSRDQAREQIEQRNYEIAIEVSQLEATISNLRDEVAKKTSAVEGLERDLVVRDEKLNEVSESLRKEESKGLELKEYVNECENKL